MDESLPQFLMTPVTIEQSITIHTGHKFSVILCRVHSTVADECTVGKECSGRHSRSDSASADY